MDAPPYDVLTDNEWYMILLIERLRGLSLGEIAKWLGCGMHIIEARGNWGAFRAGKGPACLKHKLPTNNDLAQRVRDYMDSTLVQNLVPLKPKVLADIFEAETEEVIECQKQWEKDIRTRKHWPRCLSCTFRGGKMNPILENGLCLECNAAKYNWPLDTWHTNGQYVALLYSLGLLKQSIVADYIKRGGNGADPRHSAGVHRLEAREGRRTVAGTA